MTTETTNTTTGIKIIQSIRGMTVWLLVWGMISLIVPSFSSGYGLILIITGVVNYVFGIPAILLVQAIIFLYAAVFNLFVGQPIAITFSILLVLSIIQTIRLYRHAHSIELDPSISSRSRFTISPLSKAEEKAERYFPAMAFLLATISWLGCLSSIFLIANVIWQSIEGEFSSIEGELPPMEDLLAFPSILNFAVDFSIELGVLAFAFGVTCLLSGYRNKALSILAVLGGGAYILFIFLAIIVAE